ncbi:P-loop containing nucleoside triphosphate hydrolase protein [Phycomyces nitens]|nr:P-loop containing nucleoside triphosphate hydrolase protein [Phycomyces nitens]
MLTVTRQFRAKGLACSQFIRHQSTKSLVTFDQANVHRFGIKDPVFKNLSLNIPENQHLVITGPVNAGKTTLAEALAGQHSIKPTGAAKWPLLESIKGTLSDKIHLVSFQENSAMFSYGQHYYQERFNFSDPDNDLTLADYLKSREKSDAKIKEVANKLDLVHLLPLSFVKLSNGQTRRARIARALLGNPAVLILDEPLMGLDIEHRKKLLDTLEVLATKPGGTPVVLVQRPQDEMPEWATRVVCLDNMNIVWDGTPAHYMQHILPQTEKEAAEKQNYRQEALSKEEQTRDLRAPVVELKSVNVIYNQRKILDDISWTVRQGDRWALLGPNGSGKTTLLSFLTGDHPQAYSNDLSLFGRKRGTGESIWDIKARVGLVSPEIHLYFNQRMTALEAAGTGFFDGVVARSLSEEQTLIIERLFGEFGTSGLEHRRLQDMSTGEQRLVLLVRSLVKKPELIIWDEPFQGLDLGMIHKVNTWLENHMGPEQTLIMVTHHEEEIPRAVTRRFKLGAGGVDANEKL